jgi:hypothetical protein
MNTQRLLYSLRLARSIVVVGLLVALSACGSHATPSSSTLPISTVSSQSSTSTGAQQTIAVVPQETGTTVPASSLTATAEGYAIKVFFSRFPDSTSNVNAVFPVKRTSPTSMVGTFAIQLLIAGPTPQEWEAGYFSELNSILTGPSNCSSAHPTGGPDFQLSVNMKGTTSELGTATLHFCRTTSSPGIGADARIQADINATLKQFFSIKKVVILTKDGRCFGDESGRNRCLQ